MHALRTIAFALSLIAAASAQAGGTHKGGHGYAFGVPAKASTANRTVEVVMKDSFYEPKRIDVEAGETIRFRVVNRGELVHEFNIGTAAMHAAHQKEMMAMMDRGVLEADRVNHHMMGAGHGMSHDDSNSVLLEPGKTGEIVWKFTKAVALEFACNVPGHYDAGMLGQIRFK